MSWTKVSDKLYQIQIDGKYVDVLVAYGKAQALFESFVGSGGIIGEDGEVKNDIMSLVSQFGKVGDVLLSEYGPKGQIVSQGDCSQLSVGETIELFTMASEIVSSFIEAIAMTKSPMAEAVAAPEKPKAKKTPKE